MPDFTPASELGERPQVLAIMVSPPETTPGGEAVVDAVIHAPAGELHRAWIACYADPRGWSDTCVADALAAGEQLLPCDGASFAMLCVASTEATALVPVPAWVTPVIPDDEGVPVEAVVHVTLVASVSPDPLTLCGGALAQVRPTEECLLGTKRLVVSERAEAERNLNPGVATLGVEGVPADPAVPVVVDWAGAGGDLDDLEVALSLELEPASVDEVVDDEGNPDEAFMQLRWYAECGSLTTDSGRIRCDPLPDALPGDPPLCEMEATVWRPRRSGSCAVHAVVSDGRGGVGWWSQPFEIQP